MQPWFRHFTETADQDCMYFSNIAWLAESFTFLDSVRLKVWLVAGKNVELLITFFFLREGPDIYICKELDQVLFKRNSLNCLNFPVKCCLGPLEQHCIGPRLHKPLTLNETFSLCKVVWSLFATLHRVLAVQCCPKSIKTTLHRVFSYAKLSGASRAILDWVLTWAMLSQEY